jgi:hypothetical protein
LLQGLLFLHVLHDLVSMVVHALRTARPSSAWWLLVGAKGPHRLVARAHAVLYMQGICSLLQQSRYLALVLKYFSPHHFVHEM